MRRVLRKMVQALEAGEPLELVSVLESGGSTPRGAGAMLAVFRDGTTAGTVGGGSVEYEAGKLASELLARGENALRRLRFVQGEAASLGMVCGGDETLHFHFLSPEDGELLELLRSWQAAFRENEDRWFCRRLREEQVLEMRLAGRGDDRVPAGLLGRKAASDGSWFASPAVQAGKVFLFGGGHVAQALVPALAAVDFRTVVYDDRPEFASQERFPLAEGRVCAPFEDLERNLAITPSDYVVIMTRGHQADYEVLRRTLRSGARYLGCIGSRRKLALCRERLLAEGFTAEEYARLHAPIGLAIGAETPEEIAVSVTAELIGVRAGLLP